MPFINRLLHWARTSPERAAVVAGDRRLTYGELATGASRSELPAGTLIALQLEDPLDFAVAFTAVVGQGRCAAVLDPAWPPAQRARVLEGLGPDAVLAGELRPEAPRPARLADPPPDARFYCGFTSGTSGMPKGFVRTVGSWSRSLERSVDWFGVTPGLRVFAPGPLAASLSLYALAECLYAGATFYAPVPGSAGGRLPFSEMLRSERIEHLVGVPSALRLALERAGTALPHLRTVVSGGSRLSAAEAGMALRAAPAARVFEYYGASELSIVTVRRVDGTAGSDVGHPFPGVQIRIRADGRTAGAGEEGTIHVRTDTAIEGYLLGDDGRSFQRHGDWVTVQDTGWIDSGGALHLTGRHGDMVVVAGTNVYPSEVEAVLAGAGYPASVVVGIPDPRRGATLAAVIQTPPGTEIDVPRLRSFLKQQLPAPKVPRRMFRTVRLPLTPAGKPDRTALEAMVRTGGEVHELPAR